MMILRSSCYYANRHHHHYHHDDLFFRYRMADVQSRFYDNYVVVALFYNNTSSEASCFLIVDITLRSKTRAHDYFISPAFSNLIQLVMDGPTL